MNVQVLVAAMNQTDKSLLEKMNINSDAIIGNQCDRNEIDTFLWRGHNVIYLNFAERGVGLNRNNALMRATGDICLFADDDMRYCDDYIEQVTKAFEKCPNADVLVFNLIEKKITRSVIKKVERVHFWNFLRYGTARVAVRTESIRKNGIFFNQCFGGGTEHCHGEDSLFLADCLRKGLKIYAFPAYIAELTDERESSWYLGYNEKYIHDQGVLYRTMTRRFWKILCLQDALRRAKSYNVSWYEAYKTMVQGNTP